MKVSFEYYEIFDEAISLGDFLIHDGELFQVKAFKILPTPRVFDGGNWRLLSACKRP